ncbi:hypothetical protein [Sphingomonas montanisoli]|uniref:Uncharacterized protein n=1 Tax=Sphingomonas montanisoli TaxID=2606412 RepID=A0A5D9C409_9SPHN|nr:hypothetical protein [Sphingomonas montanisoli]TZG24701.1 hypothetical protein FYJ91_19000 [Sphingomonas montanisoli]
MERIADYRGNLLNHIEALYRPGERHLAVAMAEALGCAISDTGFSGDGEESFLAAHPNPVDRDMRNNAFFLSPMRPEQQAMETRLLKLADEDAGFAATLAEYRSIARSKPFGVPHFAIRYPSGEAVTEAAGRLRAALGATLGDRMHIRVFGPGGSGAKGASTVQAFVHQDVIVSGSFLYGQLIELQSQPTA